MRPVIAFASSTRRARPVAAVRLCSVLAALALSLSAAGAARAQELRSIDPQLFIMPAAGGTTFTIDRPTVPRHLTFVFGLGAQYARAPFVRANADESTTNVVSDLAQADLMVAAGFFELVELGVALPLVLGNVANDATADVPVNAWHFGPGDVRLSAKFPILRGDFSLSARAVFTLPTGDEENFLGSRAWTVWPEAIATYALGKLTLAGDLGYRLRQRAALGNLEQDDEIHLGLGATYAFTASFAAIAETQLRIGVGGRTVGSNEEPMEADVGVRWRSGGLTLEGGLGTGVLSGYGSPSVRVFTALRYQTEREPCASGPEDFDGFEDGDFCADPDNDSDTVPDDADECANDAEDRDGFLDEDGCPDTDNDADGVIDPRDRCPLESEDRDGYQDEDGCPDPDNDGDAIPDGLDDCPMEPEDFDNYQDDDGCPEPGPNAATVTVTDTRILISERIYFDFDLDTIRSVSMPLLDQVAGVMGDIPAGRRVRVEGYSDNQGQERYNVDLSYRRARAVVEYLASKGVPRDRLEYAGYGSRQPVAPNDTPDGRALNRRVEFTILDARAPAPGTTPGEGGGRRPPRRREGTAPATATP
jgi:outer membrane protein OmpA-like peptidoglycan-associated protein